MKKTVSILIVLAMLASLCFFSSAYVDTEGNIYEEDIAELTVLGLVSGYNGDEFLPDKAVTRAEFVKMAAGVYNMNITSDKKYFNDVPADHFAFNEISYVASRGILTGYGDGSFRPDNKVTFGEAVKIIVWMLGYNYRITGDKNSVAACMYEAKMLGLLNGLDIPYSENISRGAAARLINNALDVPLPVTTGVKGDNFIYEIDKNKNLLSEYMRLRRDEGVVVANEFAFIKGVPVAGENQIVINGMSFYAESSGISDYLGKNVEYIYHIDDDAEIKKLLYIGERDNKIVKVRSKDYYSFKNNVFTYTDENDKEYEIRLSEEADIIKNGSHISFSEDIFSSVGYGEFEFISTKGNSEYDVVFVDEYSIYTVGSTNVNKRIIIDYNDGSKRLDLSDESIKTNIYDEEGRIAEFSSIMPKNIVSAVVGNGYVRVYVSGTKISGVVSGIEDDAVIINGEKYTLNPYADISLISPGASYDLYTDVFGNVAYFEKTLSNDNDYAYIMKLVPKSEAGEEYILAKVYVPGKGFVTGRISDRLQFNGESVRNISYDSLVEKLSDVTQLVVMKFDDENNIKEITTATGIKELRESNRDGFCLLNERSSYLVMNEDSKNLSLQFEIYVNSDTPVLFVPNDNDMDIAEEKDFTIGGLNSFSARSTHTFYAYAMSKDADVADIIVYTRGSLGGSKAPDEKALLATVTKVTKSVNEDGEALGKIYLLQSGKEYIYFLSDDETITFTKDGHTYKLSDLAPGDVIVCATNGNGVMNGFRVIYDYSENLYFPIVSEGSYAAANRTIMRTIRKIGPDILTLYNPLDNTSPVSRVRKPAGTVTIISDNGVNVSVKPGAASDANVEDEIIVQYISRTVKEIIIINR